MYRIFLLFILPCSYYTVTMAQIEKITFIKHDSIPMISVDSVINLQGEKIASKSLTTENSDDSALTPTYPMYSVWTATWKIPRDKLHSTKCFKMGGGLIEQCVNYKIVINEDTTVLIDSHEKFREIFAPVDSEQEAIAFAYFFTDSKPIYNLDFLEKDYEQQKKYEQARSDLERENENYRRALEEYERAIKEYEQEGKEWDSYLGNLIPKVPTPLSSRFPLWYIYQPTISSSYVKKVDDGYELLLYYYVVFSCSHPYMERIIKVCFDGTVEILEEQAAFESEEEFGHCID